MTHGGHFAVPRVSDRIGPETVTLGCLVEVAYRSESGRLNSTLPPGIRVTHQLIHL
jgi:hypothetical protein